MQASIWPPIILQFLFFVLLLVEFFIPSAGILTAVAIFTLFASWAFILQLDNPNLFNIILIADIILIPIVIFVGFKLLKKSPLNNTISLDANAGYNSSKDLDLALIGTQGITKSMLKPWGKVEVDGQLYDAVSEGEYVEPDTIVYVISVSQNKLTVSLTKTNPQ